MEDDDKNKNILKDDLEDDLELDKGDKNNSAEQAELELGQDDAKEEIEINNEENIVINKTKLVLFKKLVDNIKENNEKLIQLLAGFISSEDEERISIGQIGQIEEGKSTEDEMGGRIIEGVFDGENMIGPDGKQYSVPANYASKSKLVEGDILKLSITDSGTFVYKQIGPIERAREVGILEKTHEGNFYVKSDTKKWRVLPASVTYFKGNLGDEVVILVPKTGESKWAAVENIIRDKEQ